MSHILTGKNMSLGETLQAEVRTALKKLADKYRMDPVNAHITFEKTAHHAFRAHGSFMLDKTHTVKGDVEDADVHHAARSLVEQFDKQVRRYRKRVHDHHRHHDNHKFIKKDGGLISA